MHTPIRFATVSMMAWLVGIANAQATEPHVFVANNGNLEGSVSSMRINPDGTLTFVDRVVTGTRPNTSTPCPGCNTYAISRSPNGRFLATNHASGNFDENINIYEVAADGTLSVVRSILLPEGGLDIAWVRDDLLAVCITNLSAPNELRLYQWNEATNSLTLASSAGGSFLTNIAVHPNGEWIFGNDSFSFLVRRYRVNGNSITLDDTTPIPVYGVALGISPDGRFLYAAGGISAGGRAFSGHAIDQVTGALSDLPGSPYTSPGSSPKGFAFTPDGAFMYVSHGTDATIRTFRIDPESGVPTVQPSMFDVGLQGTLQGMDTLDGLLFALDNSAAIDGLVGAYSFSVNPATGAITPQPGAPFVTQGISPNDIAAWPGAACPADLTGDGVLNFFDLATYLDRYNSQDPSADLAPPFGVLNFFDLAAYLDLYNAGCP